MSISQLLFRLSASKPSGCWYSTGSSSQLLTARMFSQVLFVDGSSQNATRGESKAKCKTRAMCVCVCVGVWLWVTLICSSRKGWVCLVRPCMSEGGGSGVRHLGRIQPVLLHERQGALCCVLWRVNCNRIGWMTPGRVDVRGGETKSEGSSLSVSRLFASVSVFK
jgi:hypothetical protein